MAFNESVVKELLMHEKKNEIIPYLTMLDEVLAFKQGLQFGSSSTVIRTA